jgi:WD40 repeat protein
MTFRGHTTSLQDVQFFPGGRLLAILEGDGSVAFWDLRTQRSSVRLPTPLEESNHNLTLSPDGHMLVSTRLSGSRPGVWRAATELIAKPR